VDILGDIVPVSDIGVTLFREFVDSLGDIVPVSHIGASIPRGGARGHPWGHCTCE